MFKTLSTIKVNSLSPTFKFEMSRKKEIKFHPVVIEITNHFCFLNVPVVRNVVSVLSELGNV
jgi:hypothetical protein